MTEESVLDLPEEAAEPPAAANRSGNEVAEDTVAHAEEALAPAATRFEPNIPLTPPSGGRSASLAPEKVFNPWIIALVVTMGTFMEVLDTSIANVALPHIAGSLSASQDESTWVLTSYLVANAIILPISGWFSTLFGRKRFYMACVAIFTVSSFLCGLAPNLGALVILRVM